MKRVLILFVLSFVFVNSYSQIYQKPLLFGKEENRLHVWSSLAIPDDTLILAAKKPYPAVAVKDGVLYTWNVVLQKWNPATGDTTNNNYPTSLSFNTANGVVTLGRNGLSSLTVDLDGRWALNSDVVHYSDSITYYATQHDLDSVTRSINTIINNIDSVQDNTTFSDGLHKVGNNVVALHDEAHWNAYMFQGRFVSTSSPLNGQVYAWDSVGLQWKPTTITAGGMETDAIALAALIDSAAAIRADMGSGSTPDLQAVTTVGGITTHNIGVSGAFASLYVYNPSTSAQAVLSINNTTGQGNVSLSTTAGLQGQLAPDILTSNRILLLPDASDTLANRAWVRSLLGGGGGSTPGLFDVIDMGQVGSGYKNIDMGAGGINFNNGTIQLSDYGGGTIVGDGLTYLAGFDQYGQFIEVDPATIGGGSAAPFDDVLAAGADITTSRTIGGTGTLTINPTTGAEIYSGSISGISSGLFATSTNETYMQAYDATNNNSAYVLVHTGTTAGDGGYIKIQATSSSTSTQHMIMVNEDYIEFINRTGTPEVIIKMRHLPVYDTEADAVTGGLAQNALYKTSTGELRIKL